MGSSGKQAAKGNRGSPTLANPFPGTWRVVVSDPLSDKTQSVAASVVWVGQIETSVRIYPPQPQAGKIATIMVQLLRRHVVLAPGALNGVGATAVVTGHSIPSAAVPLTGDGQGEFTG